MNGFTLWPFRPKMSKSYAPSDPRVFLFAMRPVIYEGYSEQAIQHTVNELQNNLYSQGFLEKKTGRFDSATTEAVKKFQRKVGLVDDGIVAALTWAAFLPVLRRSRRVVPALQNDVKKLQQLLNEEGFAIPTSGHFCGKTESTLKRFQKRFGLLPDGVCGPITWGVLLGQRQQPDKSFPIGWYVLSNRDRLLIDQFLMTLAIYLGIHLNPLADQKPPDSLESLATAYGLTYLVPFLLERLQLKSSKLPFLRYAPFVLAGFLWRPIFDYLKAKI